MLKEERLCLLAHLVMVLVEVRMLKFTHSVTNSSMPGYYIKLMCPIGSWIHANNVTYNRPVGCGGAPARECQDSVDQPTHYINRVCVGRTRCVMTSNSNTGSSYWPSFDLVIYYECVNRNRFSLCDSMVAEAVYTAPIHLHSPSYPSGRVRRSNCSCTIRGSNMTATAYELNFSDGIGEFSVLSDGRLSYPSLVEQYDVVLTSGAKLLTLGYYVGSGVAQPAWIHVEDTGTMRVSCFSYPVLPPVKVITSTATITERPVTDPAVIPGYIIASISGGGMVLITLIMVSIAIVCYKRRQFSKAGQGINHTNDAADATRLDNDLDDGYLELVNTPNTYNKLDGQTCAEKSNYTDIHVYHEVGSTR